MTTCLASTRRELTQNFKSLLQTLNFLLALRLALRVRHHLGLALGLQLIKIGQHGIQLLARGGVVLLVVQKRRLLRLHRRLLTLDVLDVCSTSHCILLSELVVGGLGSLLLRLRLCKESSKIRLCDLHHPHDGRRDVALLSAQLRRLLRLNEGAAAVVLLQNRDGVRDSLRRVLVVLRRLRVLLVLLRPQRSRLSLGGVHLGHLLLQLRNRRSRLLDAHGVLVRSSRQFSLLGLALLSLGITERFGVGLLSGLLLEPADHTLDQARDLRERAIASRRLELREEVAPVLDVLEKGNDALALRIISVVLRLGLGGHLEEDFHTGYKHFLSLLDGSVLLAGLPFRRLHAAALLQLLQVLLVIGERLLRRRELLLSRRLALLQPGLLGRRLGHALLHRRQLRLQSLLRQRECVRSLHLLSTSIAQRRLGLLLHVLDGVQNAATLRRVRGGRRLRLERQVLVAIRRRRLQQRLHSGLVQQ